MTTSLMCRIGRSVAVAGLLIACAPMGTATAFAMPQRCRTCSAAFAAAGCPLSPLTSGSSALHAAANGSSGVGGRSNGVNGAGGSSTSSPTAMDSSAALDPEWQPVSELQRRVEEGADYEHWAEFGSDAARRRRREAVKRDDVDPAMRGVFCGFVSTEEERNRMRSADPGDDLIGQIDYSI